MYIITGGAGFIGSNLVRALNKKGINQIIVVDDLTQGIKFKNLVDCCILDYIDKDDFLIKIQDAAFLQKIKAIFHQGACSTTTEWNGRYMMENNYEYSKKILHACLAASIPFIYASSAAVYGLTTTFQESPTYEAPLNVYGYSKLLFDQYIRRYLDDSKSQIAGMRYFNVYGPGENHKETMASVMYHFYHQLSSHHHVKLFEGCDGYANGEQRRDFIYIDDIININLWLLENSHVSGIFNVGTGLSRSFNDVARAMIAEFGQGDIIYSPFPAHLKGHYQSYTQADISLLKSKGYQQRFHCLEEGVQKYVAYLKAKQ